METEFVYSVKHPFMTDEFYGRKVPDVELVICDVSQGNTPITPYWIPSKNGHSGRLLMNLDGMFFHWSLRQVEDLKSKRDYEVLLDSCTYLDSENFTIQLPRAITSLIGDFCTPIISCGNINLTSESSV